MISYCGYIALVGRPNAGKSTLLNSLLQQKLSITSRKPQTTRHRILGINTVENYQWVYVDTPGLQMQQQNALNRVMNKTALATLRDVDVVVLVLEGLRWEMPEDQLLAAIERANVPCIAVINKIDQIKDKKVLLPWIDQLSTRHPFKAIIPVSAKHRTQVSQLEQRLQEYLPEGPHLFGEDQLTDRSNRFLCAELVREKLFRLCGQEIPYGTTVDIESWVEEERLLRIHALILIDKENHKPIIIGERGQKLKEIATAARLDMEKLMEKKVFLQCWCKVKNGWADDKRLLNQLGYES